MSDLMCTILVGMMRTILVGICTGIVVILTCRVVWGKWIWEEEE